MQTWCNLCEAAKSPNPVDNVDPQAHHFSSFMSKLFPATESAATNGKSKPTSASTKIRTQANQLVDSLMKCTPHYIRCIKPNESKRALEFENERYI